jgi:hypothetical protein
MLILLAFLIVLAFPMSASAGPVILGGDDLTEHGQADSSGTPQEGWLYMQRALENLSPKVTRPNDNPVRASGWPRSAPAWVSRTTTATPR